MASISERLRKEMEEKNLLGTDAKKAQVIVNTSKNGKTAEKSASSLRSAEKKTTAAKKTTTKNPLEALLTQFKKSQAARKEMQRKAIQKEGRRSI